MGDPGLPIMAGALAVPVAVLLLVLLFALMGRRWALTGPDPASAEGHDPAYEYDYEDDDLEPAPYRPAFEPPRQAPPAPYDAYRPAPAAHDAYGSAALLRDSHEARRDGYATPPREPYGRPAQEPYAPPRPAEVSDWEPYAPPRPAYGANREPYAPPRPVPSSDWEPYAPPRPGQGSDREPYAAPRAAQGSDWEPYVPSPRRSGETPFPSSYGSPAPQDEYADTARTYDRSERQGYRESRRSAPEDPQGFPYGPYGSR